MQIILVVVHLFLAIGLIGLILIQHGKGADMGAALKAASAVTGGGGGGGRDFAQGGGGDPSKIEEALDAAEKTIRETLG